jgi:tetratricopeptide (TPR) repeat protein
MKEYELAEKAFHKAIEINPDNPEYPLHLGILYHNFLKDMKKAERYYQAYFKKGGTDPQVKKWIRETGGIPPP